MMLENADDRQFEVRFVRAAYGGGKSFFLRRLGSAAKQAGFVTAYVLLRHGQVELDKPHTLVREICEQIDLGSDGHGIGALLHCAIANVIKQAGVQPGRVTTLADRQRVEKDVLHRCHRLSISSDIALALAQAVRGVLTHDLALLDRIAQWLKGASGPLAVQSGAREGPQKVLLLRPPIVGASEQMLRLVAVLAQFAGRRGTFLAVDELELIGSFSERRRANGFQTLRALVDQNDPHLIPPSTSVFLAATPAMFEDRKMFPSYKALQDRIETLPGMEGTSLINYRANVIDLDATPLSFDDLVELGERMQVIWTTAENPLPSSARQRIRDIADEVSQRGDYMIARPRLFCRLVMQLLEGMLGDDVRGETKRVARALKEARDREVSIQ
jgi:hypothetical protein